MTELDELARTTCDNFLTAAHMKEICRRRGFTPHAASRDELARFVAPRLLEPMGGSDAVSSLEEPWKTALHRIALSDEPVGLAGLNAVLHPGKPEKHHYGIDYRALFRRIADGLLVSGVVLVKDDPAIFSRGSRYEHVSFLVPEVHRAALGLFPAPTLPLGSPRCGNLAGFCLAAIRNAVHRAGNVPRSPDNNLAARVSVAINFDGGELRVGEKKLAGPEDILNVTRIAWTYGPDAGKSGGFRGKGIRTAAAYVLDHLPPGEGIAASELRLCVERLGFVATEPEIEQFCGDGVAVGFVQCDETESCFATAPSGRMISDERPLTFIVSDKGIFVDLDRSGLNELLELAAVSVVTVQDLKLHLAPDGKALSRNLDRIGSSRLLAKVRAASPAFKNVLSQLDMNCGKLLLHEGLLVLRIEDRVLRTTLTHRLGDRVRMLDGRYLAAPEEVLPEIDAIIRKEGFSMRRISA